MIAFLRTKLVLVSIGLAAVCLSAALPGLAQTGDNPWSTPANLSASGSASQPVLAAASDGTLHALWWDAFDGEQYARTTSITDTTWTAPRSVPQMVADRKTDAQTGKVTLVAPNQVQLAADANGNVHAVWRDKDNQLLGAQTQGDGWTAETTLAEAATTVSLSTDVSGTVHLAYVRPLSSAAFPAGIYYRRLNGAGWSSPQLVAPSPYFRAIGPDAVPLSVAGNGRGEVLITWDDPRLAQSVIARSNDGGLTWSAPQPVQGTEAGSVTQAQAVSTGNGDFLMLWHDPAAGGCGLTQRQSTDGGQTWSAPLRVLSDLNRCTGRWSFSPGGDGRLWLTVIPDAGAGSGAGSASGASTVTLAAWDGQRWSEPAETSLSFLEEAAKRTVSLGCLSAVVGGSAATPVVGLIGCDDRGDVWAARNRVEFNALLPALQPAWEPPTTLSSQNNSTVGVPALAADGQGRFYALWSEAPTAADPGQALSAAVWDGKQWSRAVQVLKSPAGPQNFGASVQAFSKAEQPALAVDHQGRLHAVWSGGTDGATYYSQAYARDATSPQGWSEPRLLPGPTDSGSAPDIATDPRGDVVVAAYAVPYNEARGIYVVRSMDGGATWLTPTLAFDAVNAGWEGVDQPKLALDTATGTLHLAWLKTNLPGSTGARAIYTAHSSDEGQTWSVPQKVAEGAVDWPRLAVADRDQVYVAWLAARRAADQQEVWGVYSPDGGTRWSEPQAVRGWQVSGPIGLTGDNAGHLYLTGVGASVSGGASNNGESLLQFSTWNGQAWNAPETTGLGQTAAGGNAAIAANAPTQLVALLNLWTLQGDGSSRLQTGASRRIIAPGATLQPLPTFTPLPTLTPTQTVIPQPTATPQPRPQKVDEPVGLSTGLLSNFEPLVAGAILSGFIAAVLVGWALWKQRK